MAHIFVKSIYISSKAGLPMRRVAEVKAITGKGLDGDRYSANLGFWQNVSKPKNSVRDVSIINSRAIQGSGFEEHETRRNIVIEGEIDLLSFIGKQFKIGEVLFEGVEDCAPCKRPSELAGKPDFAKIFKGVGGLRARVLSGGAILENDKFIVLEKNA